MKLRTVKKQNKRLLTHDEWAERVLREILEMRREVRHALATQEEQIAILQQQQVQMLEIIGVLGGDVQQFQSQLQSLVLQLQQVNAQVPQDLTPLIDTGQQVIDGLGGLKSRLETAATSAPADTTSPPA